MDSQRSLGRALSPAAKHFDANYAIKQPYKVHVECTTRYRNQRVCKVQPLSAELILWITFKAMYNSMALKKLGVRAHLDLTLTESGGQNPRTPWR